MTEPLPEQLEVPEQLQGQRADQILAKLLPHYSRSRLSQWLKEGKITIDNHLIKPREKLSAGTIICLKVDEPNLSKETKFCEAENIPLTVVYEDDDLLIINKPAGLVVHPG